MSTILKALKRSEASRPRDSSLPLGDMAGSGPARRRKLAPWVAGGMLLLAGAAGFAWWLADRPTVEPAGSGGGSSRVAEVSLPPRAPAPADRKEAGRQEAAPGPSNDAEETPPAASTTRDRPPDPEPAGEDAVPRREGESDADPAGGARDTAMPGDVRPGTAPREPEAAPERVLDRFALLPRIGDLPAARRDRLPRLALNAHVHASDPDKRFVLINLERYGEGDRVAPGLTVAAIFPGGVVLEDDQGRFVLPQP